jgi:hypothetical protein
LTQNKLLQTKRNIQKHKINKTMHRNKKQNHFVRKPRGHDTMHILWFPWAATTLAAGAGAVSTKVKTRPKSMS